MVLQHTGFGDRDMMTMSESQRPSEVEETAGVSVKASCKDLGKATGCREKSEVSSVYNTILCVSV